MQFLFFGGDKQEGQTDEILQTDTGTDFREENLTDVTNVEADKCLWWTLLNIINHTLYISRTKYMQKVTSFIKSYVGY